MYVLSAVFPSLGFNSLMKKRKRKKQSGVLYKLVFATWTLVLPWLYQWFWLVLPWFLPSDPFSPEPNRKGDLRKVGKCFLFSRVLLLSKGLGFGHLGCPVLLQVA